MRLKIRCDEESEKFCKIFWELNKALVWVSSEDAWMLGWPSARPVESRRVARFQMDFCATARDVVVPVCVRAGHLLD
jgi:hypothetical protein